MSDEISTVSDMLRALEKTIKALEEGKLSESVARVILRARALQLKTAELNLQAARMFRKQQQPEYNLRLITDKKTDVA